MDQIIRVCYRDGYIDNIDGFGGVSALIVKLCEADFEQSISNMIKQIMQSSIWLLSKYKIVAL
jgi:hypothetical protein